MRKRRVLSAGLIGILCCLLAVTGSGCNTAKTSAKPASKAITVTDGLGRKITLTQPPTKVVVLNSDAAEAMCILQVQKTIIGVSDTVRENNYLGLQEKTSVGNWMTPSYEKIIAVKPELVITYASVSTSQAIVDNLTKAKVKVVCLDCYKPDTYQKDLTALAKIFDKTSRAESYLNWKADQTKLLDSVQSMESASKPKVFIMWSSYLKSGTWKTFGKDSAGDTCIRMGGGNNLAADMETYPVVSPEWIIKKDPSAVIIGTYDATELGYTVKDTANAEKLRNKVLANSAFKGTTAAKKGQILIIESQLTNGTQSYLGALFLAKYFHPAAFKNVDPDKIFQTYYTKWLGVPYQGKWVYPAV